jgi:hypothetical protein
MLRTFIIIALSVLVAGCANQRERVFGTSAQAEAGLPYRADITKGDDRRDISVRVRAGGASVPAVRETVRFQATRYCLWNYGGSETRWTQDPATGDWAFTRSGEDMVFTGRCIAR